MAALYAIAIGILTAAGIHLLLRERVFTVMLGLTLLSYAVSLFLLGMGRLSIGQPPVIAPGASYADPLPQALVLTAIVIAFGMTAFAVVLALRSLGLTGSDHVDAAGHPEAPDGHPAAAGNAADKAPRP
ncbi:Na+/H+ antiporter subunit C [Cupriavidus neocaledonicus]|uniref:Multisubunit Na+/H+ antiporter, MnhC subunit n=1 Tax=Cupriavidus neocaledonicus TaxID=1040979 RepID=A0A375H3T1_9BURK|nr:Na+/H+ antiporter subunit C [Cupriavidus neocaledonicus]SOZ34941.1 Multisubunit Na+/H+ antiporter, MnhC subunit [Cupriavidus neocaledonicus]SPD46884.1 putative K(+)/H(+) antiporter subunit C [Cupriavidus neocaledonicus]